MGHGAWLSGLADGDGYTSGGASGGTTRNGDARHYGAGDGDGDGGDGDGWNNTVQALALSLSLVGSGSGLGRQAPTASKPYFERLASSLRVHFTCTSSFILFF